MTERIYKSLIVNLPTQRQSVNVPYMKKTLKTYLTQTNWPRHEAQGWLHMQVIDPQDVLLDRFMNPWDYAADMGCGLKNGTRRRELRAALSATRHPDYGRKKKPGRCVRNDSVWWRFMSDPSRLTVN